MNYGEHPRLPIDSILPDSNVEKVQVMLERLMNDVKLAKDELLKSQSTQARNANIKRRDFVFKVGEKVLLSTRNINFVSKGPANKLNPKFIGPFEIRTSW